MPSNDIDMDNLFKNRFENFEHEPPEQMLEQVLAEVDKLNVPVHKSSPSLSKAWIYGVSAVVLLAVVATIVFNIIGNDNPTPTIRLTHSPKTTEVLEVKKTITAADHHTKPTHTAEPIAVVDSKPKKQESIVKQETKQAYKQKQDVENNNKTESTRTYNVDIKSERYTCNGQVALKAEGYTNNGQWTASESVQFSRADNPVCEVYTNYVGRVLFTYSNAFCSDTFSVYFVEPSTQLSYKLYDATCGKANAQIAFDVPKGRRLVSENMLVLNENNKITALEAGEYKLELKDQYQCSYTYVVNLRQNNLVSGITHDALDYTVDYPIYFKNNTDIEEATYLWDFGDGTQSFLAKPEHVYKTPGTYKVSLEITQGDCTTSTSIQSLRIKDRPMAIPNIFTPNNDGENDLFSISVPEGTKVFNGMIYSNNGQLVYKWNDPDEAWDGRWYNGQEAAEGTYYYIIKGKDVKGKTFEYKSFLELRR